MRHAKQATAIAGVLVLAGLVAGCQSDGDAKASPSAVPKVYTSTVFEHVTYPDGKPTGKYENNPWVQTVYVYEAELAWARAHYDWTSPQLTKIADVDEVSYKAWWQVFDARDKKYDQLTPAGPNPVTILNLQFDKYGTATITGCRASNWNVTKGNILPEIATTKGNYVDYEIIATKDGYAQISDDSNYSKRACNISKAEPSYFDPPPKYSEPSESDFKLTDAIRAY